MFQFLRTGKTKQCTLGQLLRKEFNKEAFGGVLGLWVWLREIEKKKLHLKWSLYKLFLFFINILTNEHLSNKCNAEPAGSKSVPVLQLEKIRLSNKPKTLFFLSRVQQLLKGTIFPPGTPLSLGKLSATKIQIQTGIFPFGGGWV